MTRIALRIFVVLLAIAIVAGAFYFVVESVPALATAGQPRVLAGIRLRRRLGPQPGAIIEYFGKFILIGAITFAGRRILKLHL